MLKKILLAIFSFVKNDSLKIVEFAITAAEAVKSVVNSEFLSSKQSKLLNYIQDNIDVVIKHLNTTHKINICVSKPTKEQAYACFIELLINGDLTRKDVNKIYGAVAASVYKERMYNEHRIVIDAEDAEATVKGVYEINKLTV